jgi:tetratricopeptide (TPR) repeat protein
MIKSPADSIKDNVSLIFESDRSSPIFIRYANYELQNNNLDNALSVLQDGIKKYPHHPVAHILLGKTLAQSGNYSQAASHIKTAALLLNSNKTLEYYLNEFEVFKSQRSVFQSVSRKAFLTDSKKDEQETVTEHFENKELGQSLLDTINEISSGEKRFEQKQDNENSLPQDNLIVSETLAKIYLAQGEIQEAVKVYSRLMKKNPDKTDYYQKKIDEIKSGQQ